MSNKCDEILCKFAINHGKSYGSASAQTDREVAYKQVKTSLLQLLLDEIEKVEWCGVGDTDFIKRDDCIAKIKEILT